MMATQMADADLLDPPMVPAEVVPPQTAIDSHGAEDEGHFLAPRGIIIAMLISLPFWALIAFTVFLLS